MTYNVFGGTLSLNQSIYFRLLLVPWSLLKLPGKDREVDGEWRVTKLLIMQSIISMSLCEAHGLQKDQFLYGFLAPRSYR